MPYAREMSDEDDEEIVLGPGAGQQGRGQSGQGGDSRSASRAGQQRSEPRQEAVRSGSSQDLRQPKLSIASSRDLDGDRRPDTDSKVLGMERRIQGLEKELEASSRREQWERERSRELEEEVRGLKERATGHAGALRSVQREVENAQAALEAEKQRAEGKRKEQEVELGRWRTRSDQLEDEINRLNKNRNMRSDQEVRGGCGKMGLAVLMPYLVDRRSHARAAKRGRLARRRAQHAVAAQRGSSAGKGVGRGRNTEAGRGGSGVQAQLGKDQDRVAQSQGLAWA